MQKNFLPYCGDVLRKNDPDCFLLTMFAPQASREALWALFAFNFEIAKTRAVVSESTLGLIRLKWWREEIDKIYEGNNPSAHEILIPLSAAIKQYNLPKEHFETLLYAREFDLEDVLPGNLEGLMNYADFTTTPLLKLAVKITGNDPEIYPVQAIAINVGLADVLNSVPYHAQNGRCYLPEDLLSKAGLTRDDIYNFTGLSEIQKIIKKIASAQTIGIYCENSILRAFDILADIKLKKIKSLKYNVFSKKMALPPPFLALRLWLRIKY